MLVWHVPAATVALPCWLGCYHCLVAAPRVLPVPQDISSPWLTMVCCTHVAGGIAAGVPAVQQLRQASWYVPAALAWASLHKVAGSAHVGPNQHLLPVSCP